MMRARTTGITPEQARAVYDRLAAIYDWINPYERRAIRDMVAHADFLHARAVLEFGCGTGRLARELLAEHLPPHASYVGIDVSPVMAARARRQLAPWADRAAVRLSDGSLRLEANDASVDRFVATYVLDLLDPSDIRALLAEAARVLVTDGLLGVVNLAPGQGPVSRGLASLWSRLYERRPLLVGGCRPLVLRPFLGGGPWQVTHEAAVTSLGLTSGVLVARRAGPGAPAGAPHALG